MEAAQRRCRRPGGGGGGDDDDDDDDDGDGESNEVRLPISHQIALRGHLKTLTCVACDRGGGRLATGSSTTTCGYGTLAA